VTNDPGSATPMSERMQSLLSRAVEDQLSEQRSLAGALADVRTQIATLSQSLANNQQHSPSATDPGAVAALTVELREAMRRTGERLDTLARMVAQRGEDIVALQASLSGLNETLKGQGEGVSGVATSLSSVAQRVDGIATYLGDRSAGDTSRIAAIEQRLVTLQTDMTALGSYVAAQSESAAPRADGDDLDARIRAIVAGALVGTERRLAAHVDETVLTLAEALLRPRVVEPATDDSPSTTPDGDQLSDLTARAEAAAANALAPEGPGPVPVTALHSAVSDGPTTPAASSPSDPSTAGAGPSAGAQPAAADPGEAGTQQNGGGPRVPPPWNTLEAEDADRRRGWFRSRD
jgi:hypothetical protein